MLASLETPGATRELTCRGRVSSPSGSLFASGGVLIPLLSIVLVWHCSRERIILRPLLKILAITENHIR